MTRSLRSYLTPFLIPALLLGLCTSAPLSASGADDKDSAKAEPIDAPAAGANGLEVRMSSPAKFVEGETLKMNFKFTNTSREGSFALYNKLFDSMYADDRAFDSAATIIALNVDTKESFRVLCVAEITRRQPHFPTVLLKPGQSWAGEFEFTRFLGYKSEANGNLVRQLPPGSYRMTVTWKFPPVSESKAKEVEDAKIRWWEGVLEAKPFTFTIAKAAK